MSVSALHIPSHSDEYHGVGYVDALFVVPNQASSSDHPSEGALDHPSAWQNVEALLVVGATDDLDDEVEIELL